MPYDTKSIKLDIDNKPIPQVWDASLDDYKADEGKRIVTESALPTGASTEAKQDAAITILGNLATEIKLEAVRALLNSLNGKDFATQATLAAVKAALEGTLTTDITDDSTRELGRVNIAGDIKSIKYAPITGASTVTATAAEVFAGASRLAGRRKMLIKNEAADMRVRIGSSLVTQQNGFPIEPGAAFEIDFAPDEDVPIYAISEGTEVELSVIEY